ncbi:MAG: glutamyl-tRNA reductase [Gammaproteobacteria bacterium]|jgi:glutamyl-tRNA reductase|uniref:Glutamyl-tRNA reductase n=1 Tax=Marinomonas polaris DSM 16579 TaxID=1122206 RepID=A0A1M5M5N9_9GAMM|nr:MULTISPECIES: glutamyl-tRNA reductase [Marinomonas]MBU1296957.1 glutamyl-tRNA reductase [Gammaproteobacteria bacterium]MBU1466722.1 glutamyl-tRNA reductase [Gammaproteobacteria bacterium]MBU2239129.1 glutamyl-tRNA reductase [Gammaproteobacteria bacterium]MBU2319967.1 glutamyl-tRNA reductase [Gammaproteobacteria bacterium]MBU2411603.1 glutamyl-tRNA reductase [Gammaproteobacteria bacterium]
MPLITVGINHKTAPVSIRERVAFAPEKMIDALSSLISENKANEAVIVSTCNRTELYCSVEDLSKVDGVIAWLGEYHGIALPELQQYCYTHSDDDSVRHVMRVASGLDSLILGEPQILGQVKSAYAVSQEGSCIGPELESLFQRTFSVAKRVRTDTAIGENPVSIAFAAVSLAQRIFADIRNSTALLIGAGQTIELVARHLKENGIKRIIVANRTLARAQILADELNAEAIMLGEIGDYLSQADIVISSTASQLPIIGKGMVERATSQRRHSPMLLIDIAVPRDIEPEVEEVNDAYLYTVDDLHSVIEENVRARQDAAKAAEQMIEEGVDSYRRVVESRKVSDLIVTFRQSAEAIKNTELEKALKGLEMGQSPEQVLNKLAHGLMNKLIHAPTRYLRDAGADADQDALIIASNVLGIYEEKDN